MTMSKGQRQTAAANRERRRSAAIARHEKWAEEMRAWGWTLGKPAAYPEVPAPRAQ